MKNLKALSTRLPKNPVDRLMALRDPYIFLRTCVYTQDQTSEKEPIKPAPADLFYIYAITREWQTVDKIAVIKSRRMWLTWLMLSLHLHDAMTMPERNIYFVSMKEDHSVDLIKKAKFVYDNIPEEVWPKDIKPVCINRKAGVLEFPELNSFITGIPMGENQLRGVTASRLLLDEFGFWELAEESFVASKPTTQGGGKITIISTPPEQIGSQQPFFKQIVYDSIT